MRRIFNLVLLLLAAFAVNAQNTQLPAPKNLKLIQPADLVITDMALTNASFSHDVKGWVIKVNITVKNTGQLLSASTDLKPTVQKTGTTQWKDIGTAGILIGLKPGESVTKEYVFVDKQRVLGMNDSYNFKVKVDAYNRIRESNDNNNESVSLAITSSH